MPWSPDLSAKFVLRTRELALGDPTQDHLHLKRVGGAAEAIRQAESGCIDRVIP